MNNLEKSQLLRIFIARFLTRFGDQAWVFAVPLVIVGIYPHSLRPAAVYYLARCIGETLFAGRVSEIIDTHPRKFVVKLGIGIQFFGSLIAIIIVYFMSKKAETSAFFSSAQSILLFSGLIVMGILSSLGAILTEISVGQDWLPEILSQGELASANAMLKRLDLVAEVAAPFLAGLAFTFLAIPALAFGVIGIFNVVSFALEFYFLNAVLQSVGGSLNQKRVQPRTPKKRGFIALLKLNLSNVRELLRLESAPVIFAMVLLHFSVLSPHGVLMTAFLKSAWNVSEFNLSLLRGFGAIMGVISTFIFSKMVHKYGMFLTAQLGIHSQAIFLILSLLSFYLFDTIGALWFLICLVLSRIGLYLFSLSDKQYRQLTIPPQHRGRLNGTASSLNSFVSILLYSAASIFSDIQSFTYLCAISVGSVMFAVLVLSFFGNRGVTSCKNEVKSI